MAESSIGGYRWLLRDMLFNRLPAPLASAAYWAFVLGKPIDSKTALKALLASSRYSPTSRSTKALRSLLDRSRADVQALMPDDVSVEGAAGRSIILRAPKRRHGAIEQGVLLITFSDTNRYYHHHVDLERLQDFFHVVLEPSWAGYALPEVLAWSYTRDPVIVQATEVTDRDLLEQLDCGLVPVSFGASDWVDHRVFHPLGAPKEFDAAYVASYSPGKRVHVFLRAVREIRERDPNYRALLVCSSWGGDRSAINSLIRNYGLGEGLTVLEDLSQSEVNRALDRSRCNVLLSRKEGSNRSLFESMFTNIPGVLLEENVGVNKSYLNEQTGLLTTEAEFPAALRRIKELEDRFEPREWAMTHIAPEVTTEKLRDVLRATHQQAGPSDDDLLVKVNAPEVRYFSPALPEDHSPITRVMLEAFRRPPHELPEASDAMARINLMLSDGETDGGFGSPPAEDA